MKALFSPFKLRDLELKNRMVMSPMQMYCAIDGMPGDWHLVHLGSRAVGGAGLILTECTAVCPEGMCTPFDVGIWNKKQVDAWRRIIAFAHAEGAKMGVQLWHAGGKASKKHPNQRMAPLSIEEGGWIPKSSSNVQIDHNHAMAMSVEEIHQVTRYFVNAAKNAIDAGFDTLEIHAAHGYLFHQFYSELINDRTDEYGGSFENRVRFLIDTVKAVRKVMPQGMPLLLRVSAVDYGDSPKAWTLDETVRLCQLLKENGVDFITASGGGFVNVDKKLVKPNYQLPFAIRIKEEVDIPVGTVGLITEAHQANRIVEKGEADFVVVGREFLRNPYFPIHAAILLGEKPDAPWQYERAFNR